MAWPKKYITTEQYAIKVRIVKKDYAVFGMLIYSLHNKNWFIPYVEKWLWYNSDDNEDVNDFNIEDLLYHYTKKESIA